jgi:quercetin dioxygenase-like cupin family protein
MRPEVGTELVNPAVGTKTVFVATAESTGGEHVEVEATYPPDSPRPPRHLHPGQTERFTILAGSLEVRRGDESFTAGVGDEFTVEPGVAHQMWAGGDGAVFRWRTSPALRTGELYCSMWECARDHDWAPTGLQLFEAVSEFGDEFRLAQPDSRRAPGR